MYLLKTFYLHYGCIFRYRGKMLSFNEVLIENTVVELIDSGSIVKKQLCDLFKLPDCYKYDPLVSNTY